jgi:hypothetical protein
MTFKDHIWQILMAFDQLVNALLGGWADETLSARCYRTKSIFERPINWLFFWQPDHCHQAYIWEQIRGDLPAEYRTDSDSVITFNRDNTEIEIV